MKNWKSILAQLLMLLASAIGGGYGVYKFAIEPATPNFATAPFKEPINRDPVIYLATYTYDVPATRSNRPGPDFVTLTHTFYVRSTIPYFPQEPWLSSQVLPRIAAAAPDAQNIILRSVSSGLPPSYLGKEASDIIDWPQYEGPDDPAEISTK